MEDGPVAAALAPTKPLVPGYLLTPLGWAAQPLAAIVQSQPELLTQLLELDRARIHLIALALAHLDDDPAPQLASILLRGPIREVLRRAMGRAPAGFKGVLRRLPFAVLTRQGYRRLTELLDDPRSAKLLHHVDERQITDTTIRALYEVPSELRSVLAEAGSCNIPFFALSNAFCKRTAQNGRVRDGAAAM